jgi:hypothetical protein
VTLVRSGDCITSLGVVAACTCRPASGADRAVAGLADELAAAR